MDDSELLAFYPKLVRHLYNYLRRANYPDPGVFAADIAHDTLVKYYSNPEAYAGVESLRDYLSKSAVNRCLDEIRKRAREGVPIPIDEEDDEAMRVADPRGGVVDRISAKSLLERIGDYLVKNRGNLKGELLRCIVRDELDPSFELDLEKIASQFKVGKGHVANKLSEVRKALEDIKSKFE